MKERTKINWTDNPEMQLLVAIAWYFVVHDGVTGKRELYRKSVEVLPEVSLHVLGGTVTMDHCHGIVKGQGSNLLLTADKLRQRADKAQRPGYEEGSEFLKACVLDYFAPEPEEGIDKRSSFSDQQLLQSIKEHGSWCHWCKAPFSEHLWPVGDHYWPRSKGGKTDVENCRPACVWCNNDKGDMPPELYAQKRARINKGGRDIL